MKQIMTYDEYEFLCDSLPGIGIERGRWWLGKDDVDSMLSIGLEHFIGLFVWILETDPKPETVEEKQQYAYMNRVLKANVDFVERKENQEGKGKEKLNYDTYRNIYKVIQKIDFMPEKWEVKRKEISEVIDPGMDYCLALILLIIKTAPSGDMVSKLLNQKLKKKYDLVKEGKVSFEEYERLYDGMQHVCLERDGWWPSEDEVRDIIIPNANLCLDFITWILDTGPSPRTKEEKRIRKLLVKVLEDHVDFEGGEPKWM